jgi:hypothetical protein
VNHQAIPSNQSEPEVIKEVVGLVEELPPNPWTKVDQPDGSPSYYWNTSTNLTTYEVPNEFLETSHTNSNATKNRSISADLTSVGVTNWQECVSDNGTIYYSNIEQADQIRYRNLYIIL